MERRKQRRREELVKDLLLVCALAGLILVLSVMH